MSTNSVINSYDGGVCPDCGSEIPHTACEGDSCDNCGHVFYVCRGADDAMPIEPIRYVSVQRTPDDEDLNIEK